MTHVPRLAPHLANTHVVGQNSLNLSLVQRSQSVTQSTDSGVVGSKDGDSLDRGEGLQQSSAGDDSSEVGEEFGRSGSEIRREREDLERETNDNG